MQNGEWKNRAVLVGLLFVLTMGISLYFEFYYILFLPVVLAFVAVAFFKLDWVFYALFFFTPLSINIEELGVEGVGLFLPTEIISGSLLLLYFARLLNKAPALDSHVIRRWVWIYFAWLIVTSVTSEMPAVSFKYILSRAWFILPGLFLLLPLFRQKVDIRKLMLLYFITLVLVMMYTIIRHSMYGFDKDSAHWVMEPLFRDHTVYGAALALVFPYVFLQLFSKDQSAILKFFYITGFVILLLALILSYTRAAWLSVVFAAGIGFLMMMKVPFRWVLVSGLLLGGTTYYFLDDIQISLNRNKKESSDKMDEHIKSISNVSSDASNLERLNRWHCAMELFNQRPIVGWGPGTYQFVYAPFQRAEDRTIISTNRGDGGNAHSEYLGPLAEQGVFGSLIFIALALMVCFLGFRVFYGTTNYEERLVVMGLFLGLITYFVHGVLNNFLEMDKIAVPFWAAIAYLVHLDLRKKEGGLTT
ncbi:MAG: O-antigen ligase family protein [Bacteroidetes bacterium]|nr:O-antigen ligase family protein [Bacteroidota bacterium]